MKVSKAKPVPVTSSNSGCTLSGTTVTAGLRVTAPARALIVRLVALYHSARAR